MAIRTVITRGYGNGTFNGTIGLVVTRGYGIGVAPPSGPGGDPVPTINRHNLLTDADLDYVRATQREQGLDQADLDYMRRTQEGLP